MGMARGKPIAKEETELAMRDGMQAAADNLVPCPKCRREISPESVDCPYCGAAVAFIWEDSRVACYFLRLAAVSLLLSLTAGVIAIAVTDVLGLTGLGVGNVAIISAIIALIAIGLWKLSDTLDRPPEPHRDLRDVRRRAGPRPRNEGPNQNGSADSSGLSAG